MSLKLLQYHRFFKKYSSIVIFYVNQKQSREREKNANHKMFSYQDIFSATLRNETQIRRYVENQSNFEGRSKTFMCLRGAFKVSEGLDVVSPGGNRISIT
jgi:hypothetical protein